MTCSNSKSLSICLTAVSSKKSSLRDAVQALSRSTPCLTTAAGKGQCVHRWAVASVQQQVCHFYSQSQQSFMLVSNSLLQVKVFRRCTRADHFQRCSVALYRKGRRTPVNLDRLEVADQVTYHTLRHRHARRTCLHRSSTLLCQS